MRVGILGSGLMGGKLGTLFARAGHEVVFSYARSEEKLRTRTSPATSASIPCSGQHARSSDEQRRKHHTQALQLESLRAGVWGTSDVWGRVVTYKGRNR